MNRPIGILLTFILLLAVACAPEIVPRAKELLEAPRITPEQLKTMLDNQEVVILDVRAIDAYNYSKHKIAGAIYADPKNIDLWVDNYPKDQPLVLY